MKFFNLCGGLFERMGFSAVCAGLRRKVGGRRRSIRMWRARWGRAWHGGVRLRGRVLGGCVPGLGGVVGGGGLCHAGRGMSVGLGARHGAAVLYYGVFVARIAKARMVCQHG